jgi:hypothetical protein
MNTICYEAVVPKNKIIFFVALFRSYSDHIAFDRKKRGTENIFEFYLSSDTSPFFLRVMEVLQSEGYCESFYPIPFSEGTFFVNERKSLSDREGIKCS